LYYCIQHVVMKLTRQCLHQHVAWRSADKPCNSRSSVQVPCTTCLPLAWHVAVMATEAA
jgi:hypothetical protein